VSEIRKLASSIFMFGFEGTEPDAPIREFLANGLGAVILFGRNATDGDAAAALTARLRDAAGRPFLIATDQEGGSVLRIRRGGTLWPSAMGMGRLENDVIYDLGRACGLELRAAGITMDLAPVADVNTTMNPGIGTRAFSTDSAMSARAVATWTTGLQSAGTSSAP
jgi:beta-N-acetylhexosaminidase